MSGGASDLFDSAPETINVMVGTAGHIDHGKTELVKLLTGCDTDTLREEKERGMSIDLGFAPCVLATGARVGIVDVPGHEKFIRNMVAGATGIDMVLLVVAADDGVMPQTREHLALVELLGVTKGLTAVTKIDRVDEERRAAVIDEVKQFLRDTFLARAPVVGVSPITGEGFDDFYNALNAVIQQVEPRPTGGIFRLPVERVFRVAGYGTVATGIPTSGMVAVGDTLELVPQGQSARVRGIQVYGVDAEVSRAGQCTALNVTGVEADDLGRGRVLATPGYLRPGRFVRVALRLLGEVPGALRAATRVHFHVGTAEGYGRVVLLGADRLEPGESALAEVRLEEAVVAAPGDRYVVRGLSPLTTLGGGTVLEVTESKAKPKRSWILGDLQRREQALSAPARWVGYLVEHAGERGMSPEDLARQSLLTPKQLAEVTEQLSAAGSIRMVTGGRTLISEGGLKQAGRSLREAVARFHEEHPLEAGAGREHVLKVSGLPAQVLEAAAGRLVGEGVLADEHGRLRLTDFELPLSARQKELAARLEALYLEQPFSGPSLSDAARALGAPENEVLELGRLLEQQGRLVRMGEKVILHCEGVRQAREAILHHLGDHDTVRASELRDLLDTSRKYAIALLDHFDRVGLLLRRENVHYLRPGAASGRQNDK